MKRGDFLALLTDLERQGWRIRRAKGADHWRVHSPDGTMATTVAFHTKDKNRGMQNLMSKLRKGGYVPGGKEAA